MDSERPFDDFRRLVARMPGPDEAARQRVAETNRRFDKPEGSLGRLEQIAEWLAAWSGRAPPVVARPFAAIFAGNHGVARKNLPVEERARTAGIVELAAAGGAAINQICAANDLGLQVFDLALDLPTQDISEDAAMDERTCAATMAFGMEAIANGTDLLCIGDLGAGNFTIAAAISAALFGGDGAEWIGAGWNADAAARAADLVDQALALHGGCLDDPLEILRRLGGREFAAIAGAILAARTQRIPVILDGFATTAAAAVLFRMNKKALDHCLLGHRSAEPGHAGLAERMGMKPLLDLGLRHGEATGAAIAAGIVRNAALVHSGMAAMLKPS